MISAIVLAAAIAAAAHALPLGDAAALPRPGVIVLWASWCGPCRDELARVAELEAAARPLPVTLLAIDPPQAARDALDRMHLASRAAFADARPPAEVLADWGATALPLAVALDREGRVCGRKRGLLGTDQLRQWARTCSR